MPSPHARLPCYKSDRCYLLMRGCLVISQVDIMLSPHARWPCYKSGRYHAISSCEVALL